VIAFRPFDAAPIGVPDEVPEIPAAVYRRRFERLTTAMGEAGYDALAIYADREHGANLAWLSGFAPRFEEALLLLVPGRTPTLLVGNECLAYAPLQLGIEVDLHLHQPFSLPGQDRSRSRDLPDELRRAGLGRGLRIGLSGWKAPPEIDLPYWIAATIQQIAGEDPVNAADLLIDPTAGLRATLEPEMIRLCEYAAALTGEGVRRLIHTLHEGVRESELASALDSRGLELSCHPMVNVGRPIGSGLGSARNAQVRRGDYLQTAFGVIGGLTCRSGRLIASTDPHDDEDGYLELVVDYLTTIRAWLAALRVGAAAGEVVAAADDARGDGWTFALNPGHLLHLDEWSHSPFTPDSPVALRSGNAVQQDIIPVPRNGHASLNMEDGFLLADAELRADLARLDPELMGRVAVRREQMQRLGFELHPDVLPLGNLAGIFHPFLLEPTLVAHLS
jgi:Xaa-Pro aminopeptidase